MVARSVDNGQDVIDSRDVIARIDELVDEREALESDVEESAEDEDATAEDRQAAVDALAEWDTDNGDELKALKSLADDCEGYAADWKHGEALIRDSYFERYAEEMASDLYGDKIRNAEWPFTCIDWTEAAEQLQQDYTQVDFDGVAYWIR